MKMRKSITNSKFINSLNINKYVLFVSLNLNISAIQCTVITTHILKVFVYPLYAL